MVRSLRRKEKRLLIEFFVVVLALFVLGWTSVPKFLLAQNFNTEKHFPDSNLRRAIERFVGVGEGEAVTRSMIRSKGGTFNCPDGKIQSTKGIEYLEAIEVFRCDWSQAVEIDLSKNVCLKEIHCHNNQKLTSLRLPQTETLGFIGCEGNKLTSLDVSKNPGLITLRCEYNQIATLDVSNNPKLVELKTRRNNLTALDIANTPLLQNLGVMQNQLTAIDLSQHPLLIQLFVNNNRLEKLDVSNNPNLTMLNCSNNKITSLNLSYNVFLKTLYCASNPLEVIDASNCTLLNEFNYGRIDTVYVSPEAPLRTVKGDARPTVKSGELNE